MGAAALSRLRYPIAALGYQVTFVPGRSGLLGKTNCTTHLVTVYVRSYQSVEQVAFVTAFELAHAVDCGHLTDASRAAWAATRGFRPGWTWFPSCTCAEDRYGSGDFAMVFARWLTGTTPYGWRSTPDPQRAERPWSSASPGPTMEAWTRTSRSSARSTPPSMIT
jgi:hypothetical protein